MHRVQVLCVSVVVVASLGRAGATLEAQVRPPSGPAASPITDFPPADVFIWTQLQRGTAAKVASRRLAQDPASPELTELLQLWRIDDALRVLRLIVSTYPERMPLAFEVVARNATPFRDRARGHPEALQALVDEARTQLPRLPREEAARVARQLLLIDRSSPDARVERLRRFVQAYAGTESALLAEVDVLYAGLPVEALLPALDGFIRAHPGTVAGAKALYLKGDALRRTIQTLGLAPRGGDGTDQLMQLLDVVKELESGRYPRCEWVERAPTLASIFIPTDFAYAPANIDRQLDAYRGFLATHVAPDDLSPLRVGAGYIITITMAGLFERQGARVAGVEQVLSELERRTPASAGVRYLRAQFYIEAFNTAPAADRAMWLRKATDTLQALSARRGDPYQRKALAMLASLYLSEHDYVNARRYFTMFLDRYPKSAWAWVAALRLGRCHEALGAGEAAVRWYMAATEQYGTVPFGRVLGHAFTARAYDALGRYDLALRAYERALADWDPDYGFAQVYTLEAGVGYNWTPAFVAPNEWEVAKRTLPGRIAQLQRSLGMPGGTNLERGRWHFTKEHWDDAVASFDQVLRQYPGSGAALEARDLKHQATLAAALTASDVGRSGVEANATLTRIEVILQEPYDFGVFAAELATAALLWRQGSSAAAEALLAEAGRHWQTAHAASSSPAPLSDLDQDVAAIWATVLRPPTEATRRFSPWTALVSGSSPLPFALVSPEVTVTLANGDVIPVTLNQPMDGVGNVLVVTREQASYMGRVIAPLGAARDDPLNVSYNPVSAFWRTFFPGGSALSTAPAITQLEFLTPERSRAKVEVMFHSHSWSLLFEKVQGLWTVTTLVGQGIA